MCVLSVIWLALRILLAHKDNVALLCQIQYMQCKVHYSRGVKIQQDVLLTNKVVVLSVLLLFYQSLQLGPLARDFAHFHVCPIFVQFDLICIRNLYVNFYLHSQFGFPWTLAAFHAFSEFYPPQVVNFWVLDDPYESFIVRAMQIHTAQQTNMSRIIK